MSAKRRRSSPSAPRFKRRHASSVTLSFAGSERDEVLNGGGVVTSQTLSAPHNDDTATFIDDRSDTSEQSEQSDYEHSDCEHSDCEHSTSKHGTSKHSTPKHSTPKHINNSKRSHSKHSNSKHHDADGEVGPHDYHEDEYVPPPKRAVKPMSSADIENAENAVGSRTVKFHRCYVQQSCMALIDNIWEHEKTHGKVKGDLYHWRSKLLNLFICIPEQILLATLDGSLCAKNLSQTDSVISRYYAPSAANYWHMQGQNDFAPALYVHYLADAVGNSPSPRQLMEVIKALQCYAHGNDPFVALVLDNTWKPDTSTLDDVQQGCHAHFAGNPYRAHMLVTWCEAIRRLCHDVPSADWDRPLPHALTYCGYTKSISSRGSHYAEHQSSTWLVVLVLVAIRMFYPQSKFDLHTHAVAFIASEEEAGLGERALICCTYSGFRYGGFCVCPAGSVSSVTLPGMSHDQRALTWSALQRWREVDNGAAWSAGLLREEKNTRPFPTGDKLKALLRKREPLLLKALEGIEDLIDVDPEVLLSLRKPWTASRS